MGYRTQRLAMPRMRPAGQGRRPHVVSTASVRQGILERIRNMCRPFPLLVGGQVAQTTSGGNEPVRSGNKRRVWIALGIVVVATYAWLSLASGPETGGQTGPSAVCQDGSLSYSEHRQGTCSYYGGVREW